MPIAPFKMLIFFRGLIRSHTQIVLFTGGSIGSGHNIQLKRMHNLLLMLYAMPSSKSPGLYPEISLLWKNSQSSHTTEVKEQKQLVS